MLSLESAQGFVSLLSPPDSESRKASLWWRHLETPPEPGKRG